MRLKREILKDAPLNSIVRCKGEWGVVVLGTHRPRWRTIDFWAGGRRHIPDISEVEVLVEKSKAL